MVGGIVKLKLIAAMLGPYGVGIVGLLQSVMFTSSVFASLGLSASGVKEIAEARASNDWRRVLSLKRSLLGITMLSGSAVAILIFLLRKNIATTILGDPSE